MSDKVKSEENLPNSEEQKVEPQLKSRRDFLRGLGRWSAILIAATVGSNLLETPEASGWINGGRSWVNARGGGAGWVNRTGGGGGTWVNRSGGGWINGGRAWINGGGGGSAGWVNRTGGGSGTWVNRRGY